MSQNVLIVAAHPDDEALGCAGVIAKHASLGDQVSVLFLSDGESSRENVSSEILERQEMAKKAAQVLGAHIAGFLNFPDNQMDSVPFLTIVKQVEQCIEKYKPSIVYTHFGGDLNIDHQIACKSVMTACRPLPNAPVKKIYAFEVVSSTEWTDEDHGFLPTHFVNIKDFWTQKEKALSVYGVEMRDFPHARSIENLKSLAVHRGASAGLEMAEAFRLIRSIET